MEKLKKKLTGLVGDTIVSSASVAYLGPFIRSYRDKMTSEWLSFCSECGLQTTAHYDLVKTMGDGNQVSLSCNKAFCNCYGNFFSFLNKQFRSGNS